jgi:opacity protein-like surface antigen
MRNIIKPLALLTVTLFSAIQISSVIAAESKPLLDKGKFSIGLGISNNSISGPVDDELGYQFFAAYDLTRINLMEGVNSSVEFGLMDYGFSRDSTGIWGTYVIDGNIGGGFGWLGRLGADLGDDSGLMVGAGASFEINKKMDIRLEYVVRDEVDSLQFNFLYRL